MKDVASATRVGAERVAQFRRATERANDARAARHAAPRSTSFFLLLS